MAAGRKIRRRTEVGLIPDGAKPGGELTIRRVVLFAFPGTKKKQELH